MGNLNRFLIPVIIIIVLAFFLSKSSQNYKNTSTSFVPCADIKQITELIKDYMQKDKAKIDQPDDSPPNKQYSWKLASKEPFRVYNTDLPYLIYYPEQKVDVTDQQFRDKVLHRIISAGYIQDKTNTRQLQESTIIVKTVSRYGFVKNSERIVISIFNESYTIHKLEIG